MILKLVFLVNSWAKKLIFFCVGKKGQIHRQYARTPVESFLYTCHSDHGKQKVRECRVQKGQPGKHHAVETYLCTEEKECPRTHSAFSCVHHLLCQLHTSLCLQNLFFCLPASMYQMKCKDNVCDFMSLFVSILWKHSN